MKTFEWKRFYAKANRIMFLHIFVFEWVSYKFRKQKLKYKLSTYRARAIIGKSFCRLKYNPLCGERLIIYNQNVKENIVIGNNVILECKINCNRNGFLKIGDYTSIREDTVINCDNRIIIGTCCFIGNKVLIQDNDSHPESMYSRNLQSMNLKKTPVDTYSAVNSPIFIGNSVWIGTGAIILKGVTIGEGAIVGAGSIVTHDIPTFHIAAGNPAKVIRKVDT